MKTMNYSLTVLITLILGSACVPDFPRESNLDRPRVLAIGLTDPVVEAGQSVTASVLLFDPQWRKPVLKWALALNPQPTEALRRTYGDPATLTIDDGFLYLGEGAQRPLVVPAIPQLEVALAQYGIEQISLPLALFVDWPDGTRLLAFKQVRVVLRGVVRSVLAAAAVTDIEVAIAKRVAELDNENPVLGTLFFASHVTTLTTKERTDLPTRKKVVLRQNSQSTQSGGLVRVSLPVTDADNAGLRRGDPGYNILSVATFIEAAMRYPLTVTTSDLAFETMDQASAFNEPTYKKFGSGVYFGMLVVDDRYGGSGWRAFSLDVESHPNAERKGPGGAVLVRNGPILFWQPLTAENAVTDPGWYSVQGDLIRPADSVQQMPFLLTASRWQSLTASATVTEVSANSPSAAESLLFNPLVMHSTYGRRVTWTVEVLRKEQ